MESGQDSASRRHQRQKRARKVYGSSSSSETEMEESQSLLSKFPACPGLGRPLHTSTQKDIDVTCATRSRPVPVSNFVPETILVENTQNDKSANGGGVEEGENYFNFTVE